MQSPDCGPRRLPLTPDSETIDQWHPAARLDCRLSLLLPVYIKHWAIFSHRLRALRLKSWPSSFPIIEISIYLATPGHAVTMSSADKVMVEKTAPASQHQEHQVHVSKEKAQEDALQANEEQVRSFITDLEARDHANPAKKSMWVLNLTPQQYNWALVGFASMGGFLSGLDQSVISGANLFMPDDIGLTTRQNSLVNAGMPLGGIAGALLLSPANEYLGRKWAIIISCIFYTIGAALEAGAINYAIMVTGRLILGVGVGIEGGTVPMYVAETAERRRRGNLVSLYQLNIAFGEVVGYSVGAMFAKVPSGWRYMFGSSLIFSTIMFIG